MHSRTMLPSLAAALALACGASVLAQTASSTAAMPFHRRTAGWLVSDTNMQKVYLVRDLNNDGTFTQPGEITVFFDGAGNQSGMPSNATNSVFSLYQAADGTVYIGNGATSTVYALRDTNLDGNAEGVGEAQVFFSDATAIGGNLAGYRLPTPNGITGDANAIYLTNAGTSPAPQDAIYRLTDLDHDGNANGVVSSVPEASLFLDMNVAAGGTSSSPFDLCYLNGAFYYADNRDAATPDRIYRAFDADTDGAIQPGELGVFHTVAMFGAPSGAFVQTCVTDGTSIYTHDRTGSVNPQQVARLTDSDNNGMIDSTGEVQIIWSEANLPAGEIMATSQGIAVAPRRLLILSNGSNANELILARDLNADGLFSDAGETSVALRSTISGVFPATVRAVVAYGWPCQADFNTSGALSVQDIFDYLSAWFAGDIRADFNGANNLSVQDIFDFLGAWFAGC